MDVGDSTALRIAPMSLRLKAGLWDLATFGVVELTPPAAVAVLHRKLGGQKAWTRHYLRSCGAAMEWRSISRRNTRSYGSRRMGIRCADARTSGRIALRSALLAHVSGAGISWLAKEPFRGAIARNRARAVELQPEIDRLKEQYASDEHAQQREIMNLYKRRNVSPVRSCAPLAAPIVAQLLPALLSPRHQSLPERIAGIVWVIDD
jgi:hypothetical protein